VDALYSPVRRVSFSVEPARISNITNYDRLTLEIWTDGTIRPQEALSQAAHILVEHLNLIGSISTEEPPLEIGSASIRRSLPGDWQSKPIEDLDLSVRVYNALKRTGISTVGELLNMMERSGGDLTNLRNFGDKSMAELKDKLRARGLLPQEETSEV
jgi:DNA-directed RNA polymerase subunit alpha